MQTMREQPRTGKTLQFHDGGGHVVFCLVFCVCVYVFLCVARVFCVLFFSVLFVCVRPPISLVLLSGPASRG
eukprot:11195784-Lingulodinium_polyedra.AAC.1